jgi:hypothetical protein
MFPVHPAETFQAMRPEAKIGRHFIDRFAIGRRTPRSLGTADRRKHAVHRGDQTAVIVLTIAHVHPFAQRHFVREC